MSARTVFLSHRLKDFGKHFARSVELALKAEGFDVFLDVETIEAGKWETQILAGIDQRSHFLLLLPPGCFDGCDSPDDWVRREFERAVATRRNIVLIFEQDALYAELNASCPEPMRAVFDYQGHRIHDTSFEKDIEILRPARWSVRSLLLLPFHPAAHVSQPHRGGAAKPGASEERAQPSVGRKTA